MVARLEVKLTGWPRLIRKCRGNELIGPPLRRALEEMATDAQDRARAVGPLGATGLLRASISHKLDPKPVPRWAAVIDSAKSPRGYRYPKLLEFSRRWGHFDWLRKAVLYSRRTNRAAMTDLKRKILERWGAA
jgi:hypothetical protein